MDQARMSIILISSRRSTFIFTSFATFPWIFAKSNFFLYLGILQFARRKKRSVLLLRRPPRVLAVKPWPRCAFLNNKDHEKVLTFWVWLVQLRLAARTDCGGL